MKKKDTGHSYAYPDVQYMDANYEKHYLVPWPDCQKFLELDEEGLYTTLVEIDGNTFCFVDPQWVANDYEDENIL